MAAQEALKADRALGQLKNVEAGTFDREADQVDVGDDAFGRQRGLRCNLCPALDPEPRAFDRDHALAEARQLVRVAAPVEAVQMPAPSIEHRFDATELHRPKRHAPPEKAGWRK